MIFEDLQWADPSLLDFVDYLLNWSRGYPIFIVALSRPEISDRFPGWAAARRNLTFRKRGSSLYASRRGRTREKLVGSWSCASMIPPR